MQLGDLTDYGPDNAGALRIMFRIIDEGRGLFLLGNHDLKLARFLAGHPVRNEALWTQRWRSSTMHCESGSSPRLHWRRRGCSATAQYSYTAAFTRRC